MDLWETQIWCFNIMGVLNGGYFNTGDCIYNNNRIMGMLRMKLDNIVSGVTRARCSFFSMYLPFYSLGRI